MKSVYVKCIQSNCLIDLKETNGWFCLAPLCELQQFLVVPSLEERHQVWEDRP